MEHFYHQVGEQDWFTFPNLYSEVVRISPDVAHFVEVGAWLGRSAAFMAVEIINSGKTIKFDCVDLWEWNPDQQDISSAHFDNRNLLREFQTYLSPVLHRVTPIKMYSLQAAALYPDSSLDFVFIDAAHDYLNVSNDIKAWFSKVKQGSIIAGHDYFSAPGVKRAVDEFFGEENISLSEGCWIFNKKK